MVTIRFFATLRDVTGVSEMEIEIRQPSSVADLFVRLQALHPRLQAFRESLLVAVNEEYGTWESPVGAGDEVAFFPPVSGGAA